MAGIKWTNAEINILKKWYQNGGRVKVIEELSKKGFTRSKNSVTIRAKLLGIKGDYKGKYEKSQTNHESECYGVFVSINLRSFHPPYNDFH